MASQESVADAFYGKHRGFPGALEEIEEPCVLALLEHSQAWHGRSWG